MWRRRQAEVERAITAPASKTLIQGPTKVAADGAKIVWAVDRPSKGYTDDHEDFGAEGALPSVVASNLRVSFQESVSRCQLNRMWSKNVVAFV